MSNSRVQTTITNTSGPRLLEWFPGGPKHVSAGEVVVVSGLIEDQLALSSTHNLNLYLAEQTNGRITIAYTISGTGTGVTGSGTTNNVSKFTSATSIGDSTLTDDGTTVGFTGAGGTNWTGQSAPALSPAGTGTIYFDNGSNTFQISENGGAYVPLAGGGGSSAFSSITSGTNTAAVMTVGVGAQMLTSPGSVFGQSTVGTSNTVMGDVSTGASMASGSSNTLVGANCGPQLVSASGNTFVGTNSGIGVTGDNNTIMGYAATLTNVAGTGSTVVGQGANGYSNDVVIGSNASSVAVGNTVVGFNAGSFTLTGADVTIVGAGAGTSTTSADGASFFGSNAGQNVVDGISNSFFGAACGNSVTSGANNVAMGVQALGNASSGDPSNCVAIGYHAGFIAHGNGNTFVGYTAGVSSTSGASNVVIGNLANVGTATAANMVCIGSGAVCPSGGVVIGQGAGAAGISGTDMVVIGFGAGASLTTAAGCVFIGAHCGPAATGQQASTFVGSNMTVGTGTNQWNTCVGADITVGNQRNVLIGRGINNASAGDCCIFGVNVVNASSSAHRCNVFGESSFSTTGSNAASDNCIFGFGGAGTITTGAHNIIIGNSADVGTAAASNAVCIGDSAVCPDSGVVIGQGAGKAGATALNFTAVGFIAGSAITTGTNNTFFGAAAGAACTNGSSNTMIGEGAGSSVVSGSNGTYVGMQAGAATTGTDNTFIGATTGGSVLSGTQNVVVGAFACQPGDNLTTGVGNTILGYFNDTAAAGTSYATVLGWNSGGASSSVIISGNSAGVRSATTNDLVIVSGDTGLQRTAAKILAITDGASGAGAQEFIGAATGTFGLSPANHGRIFYDSTLQHFYISENGGAYVQMVSGGGSPAFSAITTGSNTSAVMTIGSGASMLVAPGGIFGLSTVGTTNVIVGDAQTGSALTTATNCTFVGAGAGHAVVANTTADNNVMVGYKAGFITTSRDNVIVGSQAAATLTTGVTNVVIGSSADVAVAAGHAAIAIGASTVAATNAVVIGTGSGAAGATGNRTVVVGSFAGNSLTNGGGNTFLGYGTGTGVSSGSNNTFIGSQAATAVDASDNVCIGRASAGSLTSGSGNTVIGTAADVALAATTHVVAIGFGACSPDSGVVVGASSGANGATGTNVTIVGNSSGTNIGAASNITFIGFNAGTANTDGSENVFVGSQAGAANVSGTRNTFVGHQAGFIAAGALDTDTVLVGWRSGYNINGGNGYNTCLGTYAGEGIYTGNNNTYLGYAAGGLVAGDSGNVGIGSNCVILSAAGNAIVVGYQSVAGDAQISIGAGIGFDDPSSTGTGNLLIGNQIGQGTLTTASNNTLVGHYAAVALTIGTDNTILGYQAGNTLIDGVGNILLGSGAALATSSTSNVFVAGSDTNPVNDIYFGKGMASATPTAYTVHGTSGNGSGIAGADVIIAGGKGGTSADSGGQVKFQTAIAGAGTTLVDRMVIDSIGTVNITGLLVMGTTLGIESPYLEITGGSSSDSYLNMKNGSTTAVSTANEGRIIYDSGVQKFRASQNGAAYVDLIGGGGGGGLSPTALVWQYDDLLYGNSGSAGPFQTIASSSGAGSNGRFGQLGPDSTGVGFFYGDVGTTNSGFAGMNGSNAVWVFGGGQQVFEMRVYIPALSNGTDRYVFKCGIANYVNDNVEGISFTYTDNVFGGNWTAHTYDGVSGTNQDSGVAVTGNAWHILKFIVNAAGTNVDFYVDGVLATSITTTIPTDTSNDSVPWGVSMLKTLGTSSPGVYYADYMYWEFEPSGR